MIIFVRFAPLLSEIKTKRYLFFSSTKMVRITDDLLLSRAEHNDGNLPTLEEISLHQQHLEKIEYINRVCADLKILQFQV